MTVWIKVALIALLLVFTACDDDQADDPTTARCAEHEDFSVVWLTGNTLEKGKIVPTDGNDEADGWALEDSEFRLVSAYWSRTPNYMLVLDPTARSCVGDGDRWTMLAYPPGYQDNPPLQRMEPNQTMDSEVWEKILANPWRLSRWGPVDGPHQEPEYQGVVLFTDEVAVTSSACDTRPHTIHFAGPAIAPDEFPRSSQTMVCVPPPGHEPLPDEEGAMWALPISGTPSFAETELVITDGDTEYYYVAISLDDYLAEFQRDAFWEIDDPLTVLEEYEAETFQVLDNPPTSDLGTTTTESE